MRVFLVTRVARRLLGQPTSPQRARFLGDQMHAGASAIADIVAPPPTRGGADAVAEPNAESFEAHLEAETAEELARR